MSISTVNDCRLIDIRRYSDNRGYLSVVEGGLDIPFEIKRIYYLYMVPEVARGAHAHKELQQLLIATSGSVEVIMDDGTEKKVFEIEASSIELMDGSISTPSSSSSYSLNILFILERANLSL